MVPSSTERIDIFGNRVFHPKVGILFIAPPEGQAVELRTVGNNVYANAPFLGANSQGNTTFRTKASLES